jgi:hypothetical protein
MTPQERQLVDDLFDRLAKVENAPRDPDAVAAMQEGLRKAPSALYALVQTVLVQDEALKRADARIQELEQAHAPPQQSGGFLDSMRDAVFGKDTQSRGSVPNVPPPAANRPVWNSGQVLQQPQGGGRYDQPHYDQGPYGQAPYGQAPYGQGASAPFGGGGGSFLGTAAAAAAGVVGGSLLLNGIRGMMGGGSHQAFGDATISERGGSPWSNQANSSLARDAGVDDVGRSDGGSPNEPFDQALSDQDQDQDQDQDDMDMDSDDFGSDNDGGSDYA